MWLILFLLNFNKHKLHLYIFITIKLFSLVHAEAHQDAMKFDPCGYNNPMSTPIILSIINSQANQWPLSTASCYLKSDTAHTGKNDWDNICTLSICFFLNRSWLQIRGNMKNLFRKYHLSGSNSWPDVVAPTGELLTQPIQEYQH